MKTHKINREELFKIVKENILPAKIVGDIGCGIRPQEFIKPLYHLCIDPHKQYLEHVSSNLKPEVKYSFVNADWARAVQIFPEDSIETIFLLDVIEHLEKDVALKLLKETQKIVTKQIVVFTPLGFIEQNHETDKDAWGLDGGKWQEHKSGWLPEDFGDGWDFFICEDFHTHDNEGIEYDLPKGAFFAIYNSPKKLEFTKPVFTVVVPTYNQAQYLGPALDSLINQSFPLWEAVVINDGSRDSTPAVMEEYSRKDNRIRCFHKENGGVATALNVGIENAAGDWICWLSSDDLFEPDKLEIHFHAISDYPEIKFFHSHWYLLLEESKQKIAPPLWLQIPPTEFQVTRFFWANYIHGNAIAVHRTVFGQVGLFNEALRQGQDFDMWLRISALFVSFFIDKRTCVTRIHKGQTTNSFVEGGVLDSTRSLIQFLNKNPFEVLFPFTDFSNPANAVKVINEVIYISTKQDAFLYRCGYTTALAERTMEWFSRKYSPEIREKIFPFIKNIVSDYLNQPFPEEIKKILKLFISKKNNDYKHHDFIAHTKNYVNQLIEAGDQKKARAIETYLVKITGGIEYGAGDGKYIPLLPHPSDSGSFKILAPESIQHWLVEPGGMLENSIKQTLAVKCPVCNSRFNIFFEYEMGMNSNVQNFVCPECLQEYQYSDIDLENDFVKFNHHKAKLEIHSNRNKIKIAYFIRDASVLGGGTKILFKHIDWLTILGAEVTVYSFSPKPDWVDSNLQYFRIGNETEIKICFDLYTVFSIYDVPYILNRIPISKVVHICQGYEGYHYGRNYDELRADKHILTKLHAIPVRNISVSSHLVDLFHSKFGRKSEYIPNGIDHRIFSFKEFDNKREQSILFVGNPFHPLKGFDFLGSAIRMVQNSPFKVDNLKLYIVMGYEPDHLEKISSHISDQVGCPVEIKFKLKSEEIAELTGRVSMLICSSWYEGFSMPLLEAMACGTPVITTNNLGAQSFCKNGINSLEVNYGDTNSLAQHIIDICYRTIDIESRLINAFNTSLEYTEHNSVNRFVESFENLLNRKFDSSKVNLLLEQYEVELEAIEGKDAQPINAGFPKVSIVIPVFNQVEYTKLCINSIIETVNERIELIIVNNASSDGTSDYLSALSDEKEDLVVISNEANIGFPGAVNQGIELSNGKYVVIANNDIIFNKGWLERMIEIADSDSRIGLVGPLSNEVSGLQKDDSAAYNTIEAMRNYAEKRRQTNKNQTLHFPRLAFLCTLVKRDLINSIGGLDERFSPGNYEDDDYCLRAQLAGYKAVIAKDIFIHHFGSKSFKADGNNAYSDRLNANRALFVNKWGATPEEIWLENRSVSPRQLYYPVNKDLFLKFFERTRIHLADNELELAESSIYNAVKHFAPDNPFISYEDLLNLGGNISLALNNLEKAAEYFETELTENSNSSQACVGLGQVLYQSGKYEQAKLMFEWALKYNESNEHALKFLNEVNDKLGLQIDHITLVDTNE